MVGSFHLRGAARDGEGREQKIGKYTQSKKKTGAVERVGVELLGLHTTFGGGEKGKSEKDGGGHGMFYTWLVNSAISKQKKLVRAAGGW